MSKLYQNKSLISTPFNEIYNNLLEIFLKICPYLEFDFLKFLPIICLSMCYKESIIANDLASFIAPKLGVNFDSAKRDIERFYSNRNYDFNFFYHKFINYVISTYKIKHKDKKVNIIVDHEDIEDKYTVLMFTLKIGKQGLPLWFRTFNYKDKSAYTQSLFKEGITYSYDLVKSVEPNANISYLFDRFWSTHFNLMEFIKELGCTYYIRTKGNTFVYVYDKFEKHTIKKTIKKLASYKYHSKIYENIPISTNRYIMNLAISKSDKHKEPFYVLTNGNPRYAIKEYSKRFGGIEFCFKAQKSNGMFLEETQIKDLYSFNSLYTCVCISQIIASIIGIDYSKNPNCYKNYKIRVSRTVNGKRRKDLSFFHVGLILLEAALDGAVKILNRFILYDV